MKPPPKIRAVSTNWQEGRFDCPLFLRITPEGTIQVLSRKYQRAAHYEVKITLEYPTYFEELEMRRKAAKFDENNQIHYIDTGELNELRVRRCLVKWDLPEKLPDLQVTQLHRLKHQLDDQSLEQWQKLPPPLRKAISYLIAEHLGAE